MDKGSVPFNIADGYGRNGKDAHGVYEVTGK